jgi:regulator of sirC expression with transglutaminase-like and TPR domain
MHPKNEPGELLRVVDSPEGTIEEAAFVIARDAHPTLSLTAQLERLDELASPITDALRLARPKAQAAILGDALYGQGRLQGNRADYHDPRNSYLNEVLTRGLGIPITLAVVLLAVCRRAGAEAQGIGFPGHFLVRLGGSGGAYVDPFDHARVLDRAAIAHLARKHLGDDAKLRPEHLEPASKRAMTIRILANLRAIHRLRSNHAGVLVVCDRLVELDAGPGAVRDRGLAALSLGAVAAARSDLDRYLAEVPDAPDRTSVESALARARKPSSWN